MIKVNLNGVILNVEFYSYDNGRTGFLLKTDENKTICVATLNVASHEVLENEVIIKNYGENQGLYTALLKIGFIEPYTRKCSIGFNSGLFCVLNKDYKYITS